MIRQDAGLPNGAGGRLCPAGALGGAAEGGAEPGPACPDAGGVAVGGGTSRAPVEAVDRVPHPATSTHITRTTAPEGVGARSRIASLPAQTDTIVPCGTAAPPASRTGGAAPPGSAAPRLLR
ncbi:hypothetical protein GCM10010191_83070 [Actinomadura vinacea]|uniref:Uncharacterized protein n=1 Tax=Actinomadura vinacea TaxID=115336 RepID=A0ABP5XCF8_9ACTN